MGAWKTISVALTASTTGYSSGLSRAAADTRAFGRTVEQETARGGGAWQTFGKVAAAGVLVLGVALAGAVREAAGFDTAMHNVASLGNESEASMRRLSAATIDMSRRLPQSAQQLAEGLYDIESSGFMGADALTVLNASAMAASAGLSSTETSARAVTGVLNAYGMGADQATKVSDILFQTVNLGVVSFDELAQGMGTWVSTAAAAKIPLQDAAAALATITLAGVPAAEAGTALNRVIQSFVDPSDEMSATLDHLGLSLESLSDPAIGLSGVMERLRVATGGNIVAASALFPEIRSMKGALALWANEGKSLIRVQDGMTDSAGAMKRAFTEQMRGFGAQLTILGNNAKAFAISIGLRVIPVLQDLGRTLGRGLVAAGEALRPVWDDLWRTATNLVDVVRDLIQWGTPAARALAMIGGGAVLGALMGVAGSLSAISGLLADHPGLVRAIAAAFATWGIVSIVSSVATSMQGLSTVLDTVRLKAMYAKESMMTWRGVGRAAGFAVVATAILAVSSAFSEADSKAKALTQSMRALADPQSAQSIRDWFNTTGAAANKLMDDAQKHGKVYDVFVGTAQTLGSVLPGVDAKMLNNRRALEALNKEGEVAQLQVERITIAEKKLGDRYGLSAGQVDKMLGSVDGLNLVTATSNEMIAMADAHMAGLAASTGLTEEAIHGVVGSADPAKIQAFAEGLADATGKAREAVGKFFDPGDIAKGLDDGQKVTADTIRKFYADRIKEADEFAVNISKATAAGYSPQLISQLIQQGPATAGPILAALVSDTSTAMVDTVNNAQKAIGDIQSKAAEMARLTYLATTANTDAMTRDLASASAIVQASWDGLKPVDIAAKLHLTPTDFDRISDAFGITLGHIGTQAEAAAPTVTVTTTPDQPSLDDTMRQVDNAARNRRSTVSTSTDQTLPYVEQSINAAARPRNSVMDVIAPNLGRTDADINWVARARDAIIAVTYYESPESLAMRQSILGASNRPVRRWGGVDYSYANGGITPAHIAGGQRIKYAEPETGGEAYVPRLGDRRRSLGILETAAGWYGATVQVPRGGGVYATGGTMISVSVDARGSTDPAAVEAAARRGAQALVANPRPLVDAIAKYQRGIR